ncbi:RNA-binding domain-containing protein [Salinibacterium sp. ZJ454]|uniref:AlbA family DNA-binding domain-containing protein n=1 Tax=Salinibacterium sp. ZJ454 TaxID=2708339 RepID=UPI0014228A3B|nr:RNA-binding domain-containing protein [Salinibacterium sp. ZJ454]
MPLQLDTSHALRTHDQLASLIRAVLMASADDESRAVEWKTGYADITSTDASFAIARAILGMANRSIPAAQMAFEGVGYLLIGVEPSALLGQHVPDSAELVNAIRRFTGHGRPLWDPRTVSVDDKTVLVITVEPPRAGDRIALLHKSHQPRKGQLVPEGTVFVRQSGLTERASRADMEMLQERLLAGIAAAEETARTSEIHREIRTLIADSIHAANEWADSMQILVIMSANARWSRQDWVEWVNTDSGRAMARSMQTVLQNARKLRLLTNDDAIIEPLRKAQGVLADKTSWDAVHGEGQTSPEARSAAYDQINRVKSAFKSLEESAVAALSRPSALPGAGINTFNSTDRSF